MMNKPREDEDGSVIKGAYKHNGPLRQKITKSKKALVELFVREQSKLIDDTIRKNNT